MTNDLRAASEPMLSIVVPVYNTRQELLERCLRPFLDSAVDGVEVVLADDGSDVQTADLLDQLASQAKTPIDVVHATSNRGQNGARYLGVTEAQGRYVAFLDSDDYYDMQAFAAVLNVMRCVEADIYGFDYIYRNEVGDELFRAGCVEGSSGFLDKHECVRKATQLWPWIIRRTLITEGSLYMDILVGEDLVSIIPLLIKAKTIYGVHAYPYQYVLNSVSVMQSTTAAKRLLITKGFDHMFQQLGGQANDYMPQIEWQAIEHVLYWEPRHILRDTKERPYAALRDARRWVDRTFPNWRGNEYLKTDELATRPDFKLVVAGYYRFYGLLMDAKHLLKH